MEQRLQFIARRTNALYLQQYSSISYTEYKLHSVSLSLQTSSNSHSA